MYIIFFLLKSLKRKEPHKIKMEVDNRSSNLPFELYRVTLQIKFCHNINIKCFERWCFYQWLFETINCLLALILSSVQSSGKDDDLCHEDSLIFSLFKYHTENNPTVFFTILNKVFHSLMEFSLYEAFFSSTYWKKGDAVVINVCDTLCEDRGELHLTVI